VQIDSYTAFSFTTLGSDVSGPSTILSFQGFNTPAAWNLDDVSVTEPPCPNPRPGRCLWPLSPASARSGRSTLCFAARRPSSWKPQVDGEVRERSATVPSFSPYRLRSTSPIPKPDTNHLRIRGRRLSDCVFVTAAVRLFAAVPDRSRYGRNAPIATVGPSPGVILRAGQSHSCDASCGRDGKLN